MATFTLTLGEVLSYTYQQDVVADELDFLAASKTIGLGTYPIFDETYRQVLNEKIIRRYWNREIGQETISQFVWSMNRVMHEIMPKYNPIYRAQARNIDPFVTFKVKSSGENTTSANSTHDESTSGTSAQTGNNKGQTTEMLHPQEALSNTGDYATASNRNVSESKADATQSGSANSTDATSGTGKSSNESEGFTGRTIVSLVAELFELFINTDVEVIEELDNLFMLVWDNGDRFSDPRPMEGYSPWFW